MQEDEVMVSFDVRSLFTSMPVKDALLAVKRRLDDVEKLQERCGFASGTVLRLLELCLSTTNFKFREKFFELKDGLAMGSPVSPPVANLFMADLETNELASFPGAPSVWYRYVDDVFAIVKGHLVEDLLNHLNSQHGSISLQWSLNVIEDYLLWMCCSKEGKMDLSTLGFFESRPVQSGIYSLIRTIR